MKYIRALIITAGILAFSACGKNNVKVLSGEEESVITLTSTPSPTLTPTQPEISKEPEIYEIPDIMEHSFMLSEQMAKGKFDETAEQFSEILKNQLNADSLKTVWDSTVLLIGKYKGIEKELYIEEVSGDYIIGFVVLRYENTGLSLSFTYNASYEIEGLYMDYYQLEDDLTKDNTDARETKVYLGTEEYPIEGILTIPEGVYKPPVVILIQGSGQSDMDETIGAAENKPFRDIARGLADRGIASLRYNKRFYSYTELADIFSDIYDEVLNDAADAVKLVLLNESLDPERIYIAGHSLGGMLAPMIAKMNPEVAGIISLAGSLRRLEDIIYDQNKEMLVSLNVYNEEEINAFMNEIAGMVDEIKNLTEDNLSEPIFGTTGHYWKSLNDIDSIQIVNELEIPMLILQGTEDFQIYPDIDYVLWQEVLSEKENARFRLYDGLNHLFMPSAGIRNERDYDIEAYVSEEVLEDIASFILTGELYIQ